MILQNSTDVKTEYFLDKNNDPAPVDVRYEKHIINPNGLVQLQNIPSPLHTVFDIRSKDGVTVIKYNKVEVISNKYDFTVDYINGILTFHNSQAGKEIQVSYTNSIGRLNISADRVFTRIDNQGNVVETLGTLLEEGKQTLSSLEVLGGATKVIAEMKGYIESIKQLTGNIVEGDNVNTKLIKSTDTAKTTNTTLNSTINNANTKIDDMNKWVEKHSDIVDLDNRVDEHSNQLADNTTRINNVVTEYYLTHNTTLKEIVESMNENGGCIYVSHGVHEVNESFTLDKKIVIKGHGHNCELKLNSTIVSDDNPLHSLELENLKITTGTQNGGFYFNKLATSTIFTHPTLNADLILDKVYFYNEQTNGGTFLKIKQACNSIFSNCIFQNKTTNSKNYNGVELLSEIKLGVRNLSINSCRFVGLNYAIKAIGVSEYYQYTCGIMIDSGTLIMDCNYGVYAENIDWLSINNSMIDYTDYPIKVYNVSNLKVKNNYLFSRRKEITASCVEIVVEDKTEKFFPEITGNHMWNSSYGNLDEGVSTYGVLIKAIATNSDTKMRSPLINSNTIHRVTHCIRLETISKNGHIARIEYANINSNQFYMANRGIFATDGTVKSIAPNNTFNSVVIDVESSSDIPLSNIVTKEFSVTMSPTNSTKEIATGVPLNRIIGIELIYDDNVFTYDVSAFLKSNGNIICRKRNTSYADFTVKVLVKYNFTY